MTRYLQNLHTHTTYCDGKDSPEEMILAACRKGFRSIGFSGHSYMYYAPEHSMSVERTEAYRKEIASLAEKYAGEIDVFCGLEFDLFSKVDLSGYDYLIGSVHYLPIGEGLVGFDRSAEVVRSVIRRYFDGDGMAYAKAYYEQLARLPEYGDFDIVGHFDLITKHSENEPFFDVNSREYQQAALEAAESLAGKIPFFEVNTGAIARGYRTTPYPAPFLLKELRRMGFGAVISSDCHDSSLLDCGFPVFAFVWDVLRIDPSIIPAMFFANDMGGAQLAVEVAESEAVGRFNALIVSSMMGATVSFSIPYALGVVEARQHKWLLLGLLCGIVMIPFGCLVSGLMLGLSIGAYRHRAGQISGCLR